MARDSRLIRRQLCTDSCCCHLWRYFVSSNNSSAVKSVHPHSAAEAAFLTTLSPIAFGLISEVEVEGIEPSSRTRLVHRVIDSVLRKDWDSNPRRPSRTLTVFKTAAFNHSAISPGSVYINLWCSSQQKPVFHN